jgi:hypothetical protein
MKIKLWLRLLMTPINSTTPMKIEYLNELIKHNNHYLLSIVRTHILNMTYFGGDF